MIPAPITTILSGTAFSDNAPVDDTTVSSSIYRNNINVNILIVVLSVEAQWVLAYQHLNLSGPKSFKTPNFCGMNLMFAFPL